MLSAIDGPALHAPPLLNDHRTSPLLASSAYIVPLTRSRLQPKTTSLTALTAASARLPSGSGVVHMTPPEWTLSAAQPPDVVVPRPFFSCQTPGVAPEPVSPLFDTATK